MTPIPAQRKYWEERYHSGPTPWDTGITPPEVREFWRSGLLNPSGLALDLGCGTGTNVAFLASLGMHVFGVELSFAALVRAHGRLAATDAYLRGRILLIQGDVSAPPLYALGAEYILDIGCLNALPRNRRPAYAAAVTANLAPGGYYHLYSHDSPPHATVGDNVRGLGREEVDQLFSADLSILTAVRGHPDPRPSHWYLLRKPA